MSAAGGTLHFSTGGVAWRDGRPLVVLVHGAGMDHTVWAIQARDLVNHGLNVCAIDLPGHGRSTDRAGGGSDLDSIEGMAAWLDEAVQRIAPDVQRVGVAGHSMGACIALTWAATRNERVERLALLGAGAAMPVNPQLLEDTLHQPQRAAEFISAFGHAPQSHFGGSATPGVWLLGSSMALLRRSDPRVLHRDFAACNAWKGAELGGAVACPTLVLSGAHDRMTPPKVGRALAERIHGAHYELLADCGHMMMAETPDEVSAALRQFFGDA